jgi:branched-chain amino acid transport system ATP-binding protein
MTPLLSVDDVSVSFGGLHAVDHVTMTVEAGTLVGLIGPNGAGKTTLVDAITGFTPTATGNIRFEDHPITKMSPHRRARHGLGRTFQSIELFEDLTVRENLLVSAEPSRWYSIVTDTFLGSRRRTNEHVDWSLDLVGLAEHAYRLPSELSQGQRKLVGVARALSSSPKLVLLDEPAAGLDTSESRVLGRQLRGLLDHGITVLLVDHDMSLVLGVCDTIYVLELGEVIAHGSPAEIRADPRVIKAYLGEKGPAATTSPRRERPVVSDAPADSTPPPVVEVRGLSAGHHRIPVVHDLDLRVHAGEVVALLGPNGAGKTTTLLTISGILPAIAGEVRVLGETVSSHRPHRNARRGLAHVPEGGELFFGLSTRANLQLGNRNRKGDVDQALKTFPLLRDLLRRRAGLLSGGEQQMLALARALVGSPRVLMVDEMSNGLAPIIVENLLPVLRTIATEAGVGILLVEQHAHIALEIADRAYVLTHGRVTLEGPAAELAARTDLLEASYLGESSR